MVSLALYSSPFSRLNLAAIASRNGGMPSTGGYLVSPRLIASIAARLTLSGVSKSGSPTESEITSRPLALRSRAFCVTAIVADGLTRERTSARNAMGNDRLSDAGGIWAAHHSDGGMRGQPV